MMMACFTFFVGYCHGNEIKSEGTGGRVCEAPSHLQEVCAFFSVTH